MEFITSTKRRSIVFVVFFLITILIKRLIALGLVDYQLGLIGLLKECHTVFLYPEISTIQKRFNFPVFNTSTKMPSTM